MLPRYKKKWSFRSSRMIILLAIVSLLVMAIHTTVRSMSTTSSVMQSMMTMILPQKVSEETAYLSDTQIDKGEIAQIQPKNGTVSQHLPVVVVQDVPDHKEPGGGITVRESNTDSAMEESRMDNLWVKNNCTNVVARPRFMTNVSSSFQPVWVPGFPGSGSSMLSHLIGALTGVAGQDIYQGNHCSKPPVVICKTHWPMFSNVSPQRKRDTTFSEKVFVLMRNPVDSLPSFFNHIWEEKHKLKLHSLQAPEDAWNDWRDGSMEEHFEDHWLGLIRSWKAMETFRIVLYIPYENLTDADQGPKLLSKLAAELRLMGLSTVAREEDIVCVWYHAVLGKKSTDRTKRAPREYTPSFTPEQKEFLLRGLERLLKEYEDDLELVDILSRYSNDIMNHDS